MSPNGTNGATGAGEIVAAFAGDSLYEHLRTRLAALPPHQTIASERKLAKTYGVSASTVRRVMDRLLEEGRIYKEQGRGTFVAERRPKKKLLDIVWADTWGDAEHSYYARRRHGIVTQAATCGMRVLMESFPGRLEAERLCAAVGRAGVAGLIAPWVDGDLHTRLKAANPRLRIVTTASASSEADVASVRPDHVAVGREGARWLSRGRTGRIAVAHASPETLAGVMSLAHAWRKGAGVLALPVGNDTDAAQLARAVLKGGVGGVLVDDDRVAVRLVDQLRRQRRAAFEKMRIASLANVGEDLLPPSVARLAIDGFEAGRLLVAVLHQMVTGGTFLHTDVRLRPRLIEPARAGGDARGAKKRGARR